MAGQTEMENQNCKYAWILHAENSKGNDSFKVAWILVILFYVLALIN